MSNSLGDLKDPRLMYLKAGLFLLAGGGAVVGILVEFPSVRLAALLGIALWSFCRAYYFAFYVIEHYIDPSYKFAGLSSFVLYLVRRKNGKKIR